MPVSPAKRKSKIISVRISPEEYNLLLSKFVAAGKTGISALAREAMIGILNSSDESVADVNERLRILDAKVNLLQLEVSKLSHKVTSNR